MFVFHWPYFSLLFPLPLLARWLPSASEKFGIDPLPELLFPSLDRLKAAFPVFGGPPKKLQPSFLLLLSFIWVLLVLAVMRPQLVDQYSNVQNEGYDLMLAVDISGSMKALDFSTKTKEISRLDVTKDVVSEFIAKRQTDRIGLILFGGYAYLRVPLTQDGTVARNMLDSAVSGMAGDATSIGDAIGLAVRNLRDRPEGSRVLILLTDGTDTASSIPPIEAAKLAKQYNIRIYTIGVGRNGRVPYPDDSRGIIKVSLPIDEALLEDIAEETGGRYFLATDRNKLEDIYATIDLLEKTKSEAREYLIRKPLYRYPLVLACALLIVLCLSPVYRKLVHGA